MYIYLYNLFLWSRDIASIIIIVSRKIDMFVLHGLLEISFEIDSIYGLFIWATIAQLTGLIYVTKIFSCSHQNILFKLYS